MYCPRCAAQNLDEAKFCRSCGSNLSLVPQAMTGRLPEPEEPDRYHGRRRFRKPSIQGGIRQLSIGLAFLVIAIVLAITRDHGGLWLLLPAFILIGKGIGQIASLRYGEGGLQRPRTTEPQVFRQTSAREAPNTQELAPPADSMRVPPPSVTEGTTRIFDPRSKES